MGARIISFDIWEDEEVFDDPEINIEVRYKVESTDQGIPKKRDSGRVSFVLILVCILVIFGLIVIAVCLYKQIVSSEQVSKGHIPESVVTRDEFQEMSAL